MCRYDTYFTQQQYSIILVLSLLYNLPLNPMFVRIVFCICINIQKLFDDELHKFQVKIICPLSIKKMMQLINFEIVFFVCRDV